MEKERFLFTSESVTEGHPDKLCDQISDAILDDVLRQDPVGRVACETYATMGMVIVGGEITTNAYVDVHKVSRKTIEEIGYSSHKYGLDFRTCAILNAIHAQSPDISQGVDRGGAGDQGMMIGFACDETEELMPLPIMLAHKLVARLSLVRKSNILKYLGPDGKSQVSVQYEGNRPIRVDSVVLATQHTEAALDKTGNKMIDHLQVLINHTDRRIVDCCLVNTAEIPDRFLEKYKEDKSFPVIADSQRIRDAGYSVVEGNLVNFTDFVRHDNKKLAKTILNIITSHV